MDPFEAAVAGGTQSARGVPGDSLRVGGTEKLRGSGRVKEK